MPPIHTENNWQVALQLHAARAAAMNVHRDHGPPVAAAWVGLQPGSNGYTRLGLPSVESRVQIL